MAEFDKELTNILNAMAAGVEMNVDGGTVDTEGEAKEIREAHAAIKQAVDKYILRDYQLPSTSPVWDSLRTANEEHEIQRKSLWGSKS